ncbi:MAG: hypothetical protein MZV63_60110 [Marinilabiliales bacterium]|nr:hypothetical protein [Marinilabiliales bacterium]
MPSTRHGASKSPSMPYITHMEFVEIFDKETHKKGGLIEDIDIIADEFKEWVNGKWTSPPRYG